ncbi:MAG: hypothetical protein IKM23_03895 [Bacteroidales bacterium]|nr:hypothetical protein [Bacteroidales bacterium]
MKALKSLALLFAITLFTITSCQGPQGVPGQDGNANVQSATVETIASDWIWDEGGLNWYLDLGWDAIDLDMVDYGAVLVYMENPGEFYGWHQLPLTLYPTDQYSATLETIYYDYGVTIFWTNSDLQQHENPCDFYNTNLTFKVVLIDASTYAQYQNEDLSDYETVKRIFNITEKQIIR